MMKFQPGTVYKTVYFDYDVLRDSKGNLFRPCDPATSRFVRAHFGLKVAYRVRARLKVQPNGLLPSFSYRY